MTIELYEAARWRPIEEISAHHGEWVFIYPHHASPFTTRVSGSAATWESYARSFDQQGAMFRTIEPPKQDEAKETPHALTE